MPRRKLIAAFGHVAPQPISNIGCISRTGVSRPSGTSLTMPVTGYRASLDAGLAFIIPLSGFGDGAPCPSRR